MHRGGEVRSHEQEVGLVMNTSCVIDGIIVVAEIGQAADLVSKGRLSRASLMDSNFIALKRFSCLSTCEVAQYTLTTCKDSHFATMIYIATYLRYLFMYHLQSVT